MKVLLASLSSEPESRMENALNAPYSLSLAYLYSALEDSGHQLKLLFLNNFSYAYSEAAFFKAVAGWRPQVVGFQALSMNRTTTFAAVEKLHALYPETKIVLGGVHTSMMYEQMLEKFKYSLAVIGEGEITFRELLESFTGMRPLESVHGLAYWGEGGVKTTAPRELIENLDTLPRPKHEIFFDSEPARTTAHMISSRGCPYDCTFCCLKVISKRRYRLRSIEKVVEEIKVLKLKYPRLREIQFHDDTFLLNNRRIIEFCRLIVKERLDLRFICSARVKPISDEMFVWMKRAGFTKIMFGLETGSEKLLDSIHKRITKADVIHLFEAIKPYDFNITTFLMCGFPGETDETVQETIDLVRSTQRIQYNWIAGVGKLFVYPGTEVYRIMKEAGKIADDFWMTDGCVPYFTVEHDFCDLVRFEEKMMANLSFLRILTLRGFIQHFMRMPLIISENLLKKRNRRILLSVLLYPFKKRFPKTYAKAYAAYEKALTTTLFAGK